MFFWVFCLFVAVAEARTVCYRPYGCFSNGYPFNYFLRKLPQSPSSVGTRFYLYTRTSKTSPQIISALRRSSIRNSKFVGSKKTVAIVHGYKESKKEGWVKPMIDALLKKGDMNVIVADWKKGASKGFRQSVGNCRLVGKQLSHLIEHLHKHFRLRFSSVHLIGFSLGAQVSGYAGRNLRKNRHRIQRISGLDAAAPLFENSHRDVRLDQTDATFVDVIHTFTLHIAAGRVGVLKRAGHMDFYPNGGATQNGCYKFKHLFSSKFYLCNHRRAWAYFTESINSKCSFKSFRCSSYKDFSRGRCTSCPRGGCPEMGYNAERYRRHSSGKFYLLTAKKSPYCVHHYKISFKSGSSWWAGLLHSRVKVKLLGSKARTALIKLPIRTYPRKSTQSFVIGTSKKLGKLRRVQVSQKNLFQKWYLKKVTAKALAIRGKTYTANFNEWMGYGQYRTRSFH